MNFFLLFTSKILFRRKMKRNDGCFGLAANFGELYLFFQVDVPDLELFGSETEQ